MANEEKNGRSSTPPWEVKKSGIKRGLVRKSILWILGLGLLAVVAWGLRPRPIEVELGAVRTGPLTVFVIEEGKTRIRNRYVVAAPVTGQMQRIAFKAGDEVKEGETVLTVINAAPLPLLDARSKAQAEARVSTAEAAQEQARQMLEAARTSAQFAKTNWDRVRTNATPGSISASDRDTIQRESEVREREVRAQEFAQKVAAYEVEQARAALIQATTPATSAGQPVEVKAPVSGRILRVDQESATIITAGTALVEIGDVADLEIEVEILSRDAVMIRPGAEVSIEQWGGDKPLKGKVRRVEPAAFTKVSALGVEEQRVIVLCDPDPAEVQNTTLGDRYRVEVRVAVWHEDSILQVPSGALFREGSAWKTFLYENGKAKNSPVESGRTDGKWTQVLSGLKEGDRVLMHPPDTVKDGVEVTERKIE